MSSNWKAREEEEHNHRVTLNLFRSEVYALQAIICNQFIKGKRKMFKKKIPQWVDLIGSPVSNITARTGHLRQFFHTLKQSLQVRIVLYKLMRSQRCCFCALVRGRDWIPYGINEETREHRGQINCPRSSSEWRPKRSSSLCFLTARLWVFAYKHQSICCA